MKLSMLFIASLLVSLQVLAGETVILVSEDIVNKHAIVLDENDIDTFEDKTRDIQIEGEFSTLLGSFNRAGIKISKEMLNQRLEVGAETGAHLMLGPNAAVAADVGLSTRLNLSRNPERTIFINGSIYHMYRGGLKGIDDKSTLNAGKIAIGRENARKESYQLSIHAYKMAEDNAQADEAYLVIPMFTFGKKFR